MKITYAVSGAEALEHMEKEYFDFVFMDHMMPEMDGIETLRRIRSRLGIYYQKIPVIALTANTAPGSRNMFLEAGFNYFDTAHGYLGGKSGSREADFQPLYRRTGDALQVKDRAGASDHPGLRLGAGGLLGE
jgi:hypothetical protein